MRPGVVFSIVIRQRYANSPGRPTGTGGIGGTVPEGTLLKLLRLRFIPVQMLDEDFVFHLVDTCLKVGIESVDSGVK